MAVAEQLNGVLRSGSAKKNIELRNSIIELIYTSVNRAESFCSRKRKLGGEFAYRSLYNERAKIFDFKLR